MTPEGIKNERVQEIEASKTDSFRNRHAKV